MILRYCQRERDALRCRTFSGLCLIGMGSVLMAQSASSKPLKILGVAAGAVGVTRLTSVWQLRKLQRLSSETVCAESEES